MNLVLKEVFILQPGLYILQSVVSEVGEDWMMDCVCTRNWVGDNSIVSAEVGPGINQKGVPGASSYS
jgi:hypothetical protein